MHGAGNDFVLIDDLSLSDRQLSELARQTSDRRLGVGSDGLLISLPSTLADRRMRMFNPDGSESEMCGNGIRCFARWLYERGVIPQSATIETLAGIKQAEVQPDGKVKIGMGQAKPAQIANRPNTFDSHSVEIQGRRFEGIPVDVGNPHFVIFYSTSQSELIQFGPLIEVHPDFPDRTNVHFVEMLGAGEFRQSTWERGAGQTLACGTGACACAVASQLTERGSTPYLAHLPGGDLLIELDDQLNMGMTGPTAYTFTGEFSFSSPRESALSALDQA